MLIEENKPCPCGSGIKYKKCCKIYSEVLMNSSLRRKALLVIGNGFTMNYLNTFDIQLNSSKPLSNFENASIDYSDLLFHYPEFISLISDVKKKDHFNRIDDFYTNNIQGNSELKCMFERFLTIVFSKFQIQLDSYSYIKQWDLSQWLYINKSIFHSAISYNYDLLFERTLRTAQIDFCRRFTSDEKCTNNFNSISVYKPHGSIDYDIPNGAIQAPDDAFWRHIITYNNTVCFDGVFQSIIPKNKWILPRRQIDIVAPSQTNNLMSYSWIREIYNKIKVDSSAIDIIINFGYSFREEDRFEYNQFLDNFNDRVIKVINCNIEDSIDLKINVESRGHSYLYIDIKNNFPWRIMDFV